MNVNLKLMHTFLLVAEYGSFCRAAEASNRSHSAVSMQIRQLERQLGVSLFHRTTRRVQLTREGDLLLVCARRAVAEMQSGLRQIKDAVNIQRGRVQVACEPILAATRLPDVLAAFQRIYPGVSVQVRELSSTDMQDCIRRQDVDCGIGPRSANAPELQFEPILRDAIYALVPADLAVGRRSSISLLELSQMPTLVLTGSAAMHSLLERAQKAAGVTLDIKYEVQQVQTQIAMAAAGLGAAILPRMAIPPKPDPRLRALPIAEPPVVRELCIITLRGQLLSPVAARFVEMLDQMLNHAPVPAEPPLAAGSAARPGLARHRDRHSISAMSAPTG